LTMGKGLKSGFLFIGGIRVPVMEYDDMAKVSEGAQKLGVVHGGVDNPGALFAGYGALCDISQLSFLLKLFFNGTVNCFFKADQQQWIIYAGGGDFFVIGPWNRVIDSVTNFRKAFSRYTCGNGLFSFSAAFELTGSVTPATVAAQLERRVKELKRDDGISFLGRGVAWDDFFWLQHLQLRLKDLLDRGVIGNAYVQLLKRISAYNHQDRPEAVTGVRQQARYHRWKWYYAWSVAGLAGHTQDDEVKMLLKELEGFLFRSTYGGHDFIERDSLYLMDIPVRRLVAEHRG